MVAETPEKTLEEDQLLDAYEQCSECHGYYTPDPPEFESRTYKPQLPLPPSPPTSSSGRTYPSYAAAAASALSQMAEPPRVTTNIRHPTATPVTSDTPVPNKTALFEKA